MWMTHDGWSWWMLFGGMGMLLFWGALIWLAAVLVRSTSQPQHHHALFDAQDPAHILARRFASGELTEEEFKAAADILNGQRGAH